MRPGWLRSNWKTRNSRSGAASRGKQVVDAAVFEQTLAAALDARSDDNLRVVARTDARAPLGLDEAIERANRSRKPVRTSSSSRRRRTPTKSSASHAKSTLPY